MRGSRGVLAVLLLGLLLAASCSKNRDDLPVAKVGDRTITLSVFEKTYFAVDPKFLPEDTGVEGLKEFLNTMINKDVMAIKADELGYEKDPFVLQGMEAFKKVSLPAAYLKIKVGDKINVTEADLKKAYEKYQTNIQMKEILTDTKAQADEAYELLKQGTDFESVVKQYSKDPDAASGGTVLNALWGTFEPEFQDVLFDTPVGGFTPPLPTRYGWIVAKVIESNQPKRRPYEEAKPDLEKLVARLEEIRQTNKVTDEVRARHKFQWYEDNIAIAFDAIPPDRPLTSPPDRSTEVYPLLQFDPRDLDKPLVSYDNKSITIKDFSDLYDKSSFFTRPRREFRHGDIKKFLMDIVMNELVVIELKESRIEEDPQVVAAMDKKREQFMVDKLYQDLVDRQTEVLPEEAGEYYNNNREQFRRAEERRFAMILTGSLESATEALNKVKRGVPFDSVSNDYSIPDITREERLGSRAVANGQHPEFDQVGFSLEKVGEVSHPFETSRGWMILKLVERRPERIIELEDAMDDIRGAVKTLKNEQRLNSLLEKWRSEIKIEINENNLKKANVKDRPRKGVRFT
ncbi:MAG: PpiC-type peptidyl-prolyl cis-trans isomerase [Candidatus Krumholzibacteriota bacterium]|nr:PpiC-type peptidyl-prolyl cis-trans isomerase [Candidatus Krumholzibacteriota bacterium]